MKGSLIVFMLGFFVIFVVMFRVLLIACGDPKDYKKHKNESKLLGNIFIASLVLMCASVAISYMASLRH